MRLAKATDLVFGARRKTMKLIASIFVLAAAFQLAASLQAYEGDSCFIVRFENRLSILKHLERNFELFSKL